MSQVQQEVQGFMAEEIIQALLDAKGVYKDDHDGLEAKADKVAKYAGIFVNRIGKRFAFIGGDWEYFSINEVDMEFSGDVVLCRNSVGGVVLRSADHVFHTSVLNFNNSQNDSAHISEIWDVATGVKTVCHQIPTGAIKPYLRTNINDAEGTIFNPVEFDDVTTGRKNLAWQITRNTKLTPEEVFVREVAENGNRARYVRLDLFLDPAYIEARRSNNALRELPRIQKAIDQFFELRPNLKV